MVVKYMTSAILGTGSALPKKVVSNNDLAQIVETSDEWIQDRTGICTRHIAVDETTETLSIEAGQKALENAGILPEQIDLLLVATLTPDGSMPNTACKVQAALGAKNAMCYEINAACSGFMHGLQTAHAFIASGLIKYALVIGAETLSKIMDWTDRSTCVLFGDGAGAAVMGASQKGIICIEGGADGAKGEVLTCGNAPLVNPYTSQEPTSPYVYMDGQEVFKFAVRKIPAIVNNLLEKSGHTKDDLDLILLHQANKRILQSAAKRLDADESMFPMNLDRYGNTSAASVAILLDEVNRSGKLKNGDLIAMAGFGGGLTWAGLLLEWNTEKK